MRSPRVETRGYFLASLTGLTLVAPLISGLNPGLFSVAPSGLRIPDPPCNVGAAPRGCPSGSNGDTESRRGRRLEHVPVLVRCGTGAPAGHLSLSFSVVRQRGLRGHSASPGLQPANPRHAYIGFRQGQEKTGFAPRANRVPQGRKRIAPGFNPGIDVAPRSSPVGTTESGLAPRCIWDHIRSRAV